MPDCLSPDQEDTAGAAFLFAVKEIVPDQKKKRYDDQSDQIMACEKKHKQHSHCNPKRNKSDHSFHA